MNSFVMYGTAILSIAIIGYMLVKKMDIKITLFFIGVILMYIAIFAGNTIAIKDFKSSGAGLLDPLLAIVSTFKSTLAGAGFIILLLGGYAAYMSEIGANEITVSVLSKPIKNIRSPYVLVPVVFLLGNLLSLVIPSA